MNNTKTPILGFEGEFRFLSNFYLNQIEYKNEKFESVEHAYQAQKTTNQSDFELIQNSFSPYHAKKFAKDVKLREDWEKAKDGIMLDLIRIKFSTSPMKEKLIETDDSYLEETNYWGDTYWGVFNDKGKNKLGKILMKVREELINKTGL